MASKKRTESEVLFEDFCRDLGIVWQRIPESKSRSPDYWLKIGEHEPVVEVKQCDPNPTEKRARVMARQLGRAWVVDTPGRRVRKQIDKAMPQLKALANGRRPTILVVYDNDTFCGTDANDVKAAMFGDEKTVVTLSRHEVVSVSATHRGGGRRCTTRDNTSLSAVALLLARDNDVRMLVFHNCYATNPLPPDALRHPAIEHYQYVPEDNEHIYEWHAW